MHDMRNRFLHKLRDTSGESLVEVLSAMLIATLSLIMLANALSSAVRIVRDSEDAMVTYYAQSNALATASQSGTFNLNLSTNTNAGLVSNNTIFKDVSYTKSTLFGTTIVSYS